MTESIRKMKSQNKLNGWFIDDEKDYNLSMNNLVKKVLKENKFPDDIEITEVDTDSDCMRKVYFTTNEPKHNEYNIRLWNIKEKNTKKKTYVEIEYCTYRYFDCDKCKNGSCLYTYENIDEYVCKYCIEKENKAPII